MVGGILAYRFLVHPAIERWLALGADASSIVRRLGVLVAAVASYAVFVRVVERRVPRELKPRPLQTLLAGLIGSASIGLTIAVLFACGFFQMTSSRGWSAAWGVFGAILVAATLEEITFRGLLFRIVEDQLGTRFALVVSALTFGAMHLANHGARWVTLASVTLLGLMWAEVFVVTRNLWATAAHHAAWNATIFVVGLPLSGSEEWQARAPWEAVARGSELVTGGAFGPEDSLLNLAVVAAMLFVGWRFVLGRAISGGPSKNEEGQPLERVTR